MAGLCCQSLKSRGCLTLPSWPTRARAGARGESNVFSTSRLVGFQRHGLGFFALFLPTGTPLALVPLLVIIELVSYLSRVFSLGVRLTANMIGGHVLLKILSTFMWKMIMAGPVLFVVSLLSLAFLTILVGLELAIAILQAYVFTILTCSYLKDVIDLH